MKSKLKILGIIGLFLFFGIALANAGIIQNTGTIAKQYQTAKGGLHTGSLDVVSGHGEVITGVLCQASSSATNFVIYDMSDATTPANASVVFETAVAASGGTYYDLTQAPIATANGIVTGKDQAGGGIVVYTRQ